MNCDYPLPRFVDVEASSLASTSYPIEIAWSDNRGKIENYLINPHCIPYWTDWDFQAQSLHGISHEQCVLNGSQPEFVCRRLSQSIKPGEIIYADGSNFDQAWVDELFLACTGTMGFSQFKIVHSDTLLLPLIAKLEPDSSKCRELYDKLKIIARNRIGGKRHRAMVDVRYLIELYKICAELMPAKPAKIV